jgi:hypothetical protein
MKIEDCKIGSVVAKKHIQDVMYGTITGPVVDIPDWNTANPEINTIPGVVVLWNIDDKISMHAELISIDSLFSEKEALERTTLLLVEEKYKQETMRPLKEVVLDKLTQAADLVDQAQQAIKSFAVLSDLEESDVLLEAMNNCGWRTSSLIC